MMGDLILARQVNGKSENNRYSYKILKDSSRFFYFLFFFGIGKLLMHPMGFIAPEFMLKFFVSVGWGWTLGSL